MSPLDESKRLNVLRLYNILDSAAEELFDDLTRLATTICETPIGLVSLIDRDRQWFKSRVGLDVKETPREQAFCDHAIGGADLMIVEDASKDPRFADNPLVSGAMKFRFYAGAPLVVSEGVALGTLCVIDREPRQLTAIQKQALLVLRQAVVTQIEHRRARLDQEALSRLLPMCSWCRAVQVEAAEQKSWVPIVEYLSKFAPLTHGVCPTCLKAQLEDE